MCTAKDRHPLRAVSTSSFEAPPHSLMRCSIRNPVFQRHPSGSMKKCCPATLSSRVRSWPSASSAESSGCRSSSFSTVGGKSVCCSAGSTASRTMSASWSAPEDASYSVRLQLRIAMRCTEGKRRWRLRLERSNGSKKRPSSLRATGRPWRTSDSSKAWEMPYCRWAVPTDSLKWR